MRRTSVISTLVAAGALAGALAGVATGAGVAGSAANPVRATTSPVRGFAPATVVARPGARVHVRNVDRARHNIIEDRPGGGRARFRSGAPTTRDFTVRVPTRAGTYTFICQVHGFMRGTLRVRR